MRGIIYALLAAITWGIDYAVAERVVKKTSVLTILSVQMLVGAIIFGLFNLNNFKTDFQTLQDDSKLSNVFILNIIAFNLGMFFIAKSIQHSSAAIAGIIEISYPLFIILAAWLIFGENQLSWPVVIGGLLIFSGIIIITLNNPH